MKYVLAISNLMRFSKVFRKLIYNSNIILYSGQTGQTTAIKHTVVREAKFTVSQHDGGPTESPMKPLGPSQHYSIEGLKGGP